MPVSTRILDDQWLSEYKTAWSSGDEPLLRRYFSEDGIYVEGGMGESYEGVDQVARFFRFMLRFSSDTVVDFTSAIQNDRDVALRWTWWGTADGPLKIDGVVYAATNRPYSIDGVAICRLAEDGRIAMHHDFYDVRTLMRQVGVLN